MRKAVVAVSLSLALVALIFAWSAHASTSSSGGAAGETLVDVPRLLEEQAAIQQAKTLDLRQRTERAQLENQARQARELGDRAPVATVAPMATIAPVETVPPPPG
jgi:hypothetical protein